MPVPQKEYDLNYCKVFVPIVLHPYNVRYILGKKKGLFKHLCEELNQPFDEDYEPIRIGSDEGNARCIQYIGGSWGKCNPAYYILEAYVERGSFSSDEEKLRDYFNSQGSEELESKADYFIGLSKDRKFSYLIASGAFKPENCVALHFGALSEYLYNEDFKKFRPIFESWIGVKTVEIPTTTIFNLEFATTCELEPYVFNYVGANSYWFNRQNFALFKSKLPEDIEKLQNKIFNKDKDKQTLLQKLQGGIPERPPQKTIFSSFFKPSPMGEFFEVIRKASSIEEVVVYCSQQSGQFSLVCEHLISKRTKAYKELSNDNSSYFSLLPQNLLEQIAATNFKKGDNVPKDPEYFARITRIK